MSKNIHKTFVEYILTSDRLKTGPVYPWDYFYTSGESLTDFTAIGDPSYYRENGLRMWDFIMAAGRKDEKIHKSRELPARTDGKINTYWTEVLRRWQNSGELSGRYSLNCSPSYEIGALLEMAHVMTHLYDLYQPLPSSNEKRFGALSGLFLEWVSILAASYLFGIKFKMPEYPDSKQKPVLPKIKLSHYLHIAPVTDDLYLAMPASLDIVDEVLMILGCYVPIEGTPENRLSWGGPSNKVAGAFMPESVNFFGGHSAWELSGADIYKKKIVMFDRRYTKKIKPEEFRLNVDDCVSPAIVKQYIDFIDDLWMTRHKNEDGWCSYDDLLDIILNSMGLLKPLPCRDCFLYNKQREEGCRPPEGFKPFDAWKKHPEWYKFKTEVSLCFTDVRRARRKLVDPEIYRKVVRISNNKYKSLFKKRRKVLHDYEQRQK